MNENNEMISDDALFPGRLGKLPAKTSMKSLLLSDFTRQATAELPPAKTDFWRKRKSFPLRTFGNTKYGCCTRAKQAIAMMRMERIETGKLIEITDEEIIRVYTDMSNRLYGGGDNGAYETDALSEWRKPDLTFRDKKGNPLVIDAFLKIQHSSLEAVKNAVWTAQAHGIAVCLNLPRAFAAKGLTVWDIPENEPLIGDKMPGTWGGHSMWVNEYNEFGVRHPTTWGLPDIWISWRAFLAYCDEAYLVIDSADKWRKQAANKFLNLDAVVEAVNGVSAQKIK